MAREIAEWYLMISGERVGPMSRAEVGMQVASGAIDGETHVWRSGMADWLTGSEIPELAALFDPDAPPPPPPPPRSKPVSSPKLKSPGGVDKSASASRPGGNKPGALKPVMTVRSAGAPTRARAGSPEAPGRLRSAYEASNDEVGKGLKELDTGHFRLAEQAAEGPTGKNEGASEFDTNHFNLKNLAAEKEAMKKGGKGEGAATFDTGHFNLKELDAQKEALKKGAKGGKGEGVAVFDTGHFNLKDLDAQKEALKKGNKPGKGEGVSVFDTGHFNLKELDAQKAAARKGPQGKGEGALEFDTSHFRLNDLKKPGSRATADKEPLQLDDSPVEHQAGISAPVDPSAPSMKRPPSKPPPSKPPPPSGRSSRPTSEGVPVAKPASGRTAAKSEPAAAAKPVSARTKASVAPTIDPDGPPVRPASVRAPSSAGRPAQRPTSAYRQQPQEESGGSMAVYILIGLAVVALVGVYLLFR